MNKRCLYCFCFMGRSRSLVGGGVATRKRIDSTR